MDKTPNYQLSQWERTDQVLMEDFNSDNAKIDGALKAEADAQAALQTALNRKGNCSIGFFTYQGTGKGGPSNPTRISFPRMPSVFIVAGQSGLMVGQGGQNWATVCAAAAGDMNTSLINVSWSGSTCSFYFSNEYPGIQMNRVGQHLVIAFYSES